MAVVVTSGFAGIHRQVPHWKPVVDVWAQLNRDEFHIIQDHACFGAAVRLDGVPQTNGWDRDGG
jgi:hypothetical protein